MLQDAIFEKKSTILGRVRPASSRDAPGEHWSKGKYGIKVYLLCMSKHVSCLFVFIHANPKYVR